MPKVLQINICTNYSTGYIAENIGKLAIADGWDSYFAFSRGKEHESASVKNQVANKLNLYCHILETSIFDKNSYVSRLSTHIFTRKLILP